MSLKPSSITKRLKTKWIGHPYLYLPSAGSTNDLLKELADSGNETSSQVGTVVLADFQEHGRGRLGRDWQAPPATSLLFSILLRPNWPAQQLPWLTMIAGLAVSEAVTGQTALATGIKWPNDCVVSQQRTWRKYCGILLEGHFTEDGQLAEAIVGIGVNVNIQQADLPPVDFPATSLFVAAGQPLSRPDLLVQILYHFEQWYELADAGVSPHQAWRQQLIFMNTQIVVSQPGRENLVSGVAVDTDEQGCLLIRDEHGQLHRIAAGDVSLRQYES